MKETHQYIGFYLGEAYSTLRQNICIAQVTEQQCFPNMVFNFLTLASIILKLKSNTFG